MTPAEIERKKAQMARGFSKEVRRASWLSEELTRIAQRGAELEAEGAAIIHKATQERGANSEATAAEEKRLLEIKAELDAMAARLQQIQAAAFRGGARSLDLLGEAIALLCKSQS